MEELFKLVKHPAIIIVLLAGIGVTNIVNLKLSTDENVVRPDKYTGTDASERAEYVDERYVERVKTVDRRLRECDDAILAERQWRDAHLEWGTAINAIAEGRHERHEAQIQELYRRLP